MVNRLLEEVEVRRVVVNNIVSLDGYYADELGNPLVLDMDAAFDRANVESIERAGVVLLGRDSFDGFSTYWPYIADAPPASDPREARQRSDVNRALSRRYNELPKVVISDRGPIDPDNPWAGTTIVIGRSHAASWLAASKAAGEDDILVFGSRRTWTALLADSLVDKLHLMVSAVALGRGTRLFEQPVDLDLIDVRRFEGSTNVQLRYGVRSAST